MPDPLIGWVAREEGFRARPYRCSAGFLSVGYGLNLDAGISEEEARLLLTYRLAKLASEITVALPWWAGLDEARRGVLLAMAYQLGVRGLLQFRATLELVRAGDYEGAAKQMLKSRWAKQTPQRAQRTADAMRVGLLP